MILKGRIHNSAFFINRSFTSYEMKKYEAIVY
jgi:hypothetical protein